MIGRKQKAAVIKYGDIENAVQKGLDNATWALGLKTASVAKGNARVKFGSLAASVMAVNDKGTYGFGQTAGGPGGGEPIKPLSGRPAAHEVFVGSNMEYAIYQEFGTRMMQASPFLRPAIERVAMGQSASRVIAKYNNEAVRKAVMLSAKKVIPI